LGNGIIGQYKLIAISSIPVGTTVYIKTSTYSNSLGWNTITFTTTGQTALLRCITVNGTPTWIAVSNFGATGAVSFSTV
jgi:hypothetical protein